MNAVQSIARQCNAEVPFVDLGQEALSTESAPHFLQSPGMSAISLCNSCFRHLVFLNIFEYASEVLKLRKENDLERLVDVLVRAASWLIGERMGQRVRWLET